MQAMSEETLGRTWPAGEEAKAAVGRQTEAQTPIDVSKLTDVIPAMAT